ncbi:MAG: TetR/AcrR family transcriptional regulator [Bacillota bacterium]
MEPKTSKSSRTRLKILTAARTTFSEKGFADTTIEDIANLAGVNRAHPYAFFTDKEDLYNATMAGCLQVYKGVLEACPIDEQDSPVTKVRKIVESILKMGTEHRECTDLFRWDTASGNLAFADAYRSGGNFAFSSLVDAIDEGVQREIFRADLDVVDAAMTVIMICFQYFLRREVIESLREQTLEEYFAQPGIKEQITDYCLRVLIR